MAHMIGEYDLGAVGFVEQYGGTWHGMPQYKEINGPLCAEEVERTMNFDIEKQPSYRKDQDGNVKPLDGTWNIIRTDKDRVLVPAVGRKFTALPHLSMFNRVNEGLLKKYKDIEIESAGTLENGATAFVNLKIKELSIKGDQSSNVSRMMFFNPLGKGAYSLGVHNVRIVCNNTLTASEAQAKANATLNKVPHTRNADKKINNILVDLAEVRLGLDKFEHALNELAAQDVTEKIVENFFNNYIPIDNKQMSKSAVTRRNNYRDRIRDQFESDQSLDKRIERSKYSLLQAVTYVEDHPENISEKNDEAFIQWDSILGGRSLNKSKALDMLQAA